MHTTIRHAVLALSALLGAAPALAEPPRLLKPAEAVRHQSDQADSATLVVVHLLPGFHTGTLFVDGAEAARIDTGQSAVVRVQPGERIVEFESIPSRNELIKDGVAVQARPGETLYLVVYGLPVAMYRSTLPRVQKLVENFEISQSAINHRAP